MLDPSLTRNQSAAIKTYLNVQEGDNTASNLNRFTRVGRATVSWRCQSHSLQHLSPESPEGLKAFVCGDKGHIGKQQARLQVELGSSVEAYRFLSLLMEMICALDVALKLNWEATRPHGTQEKLDSDHLGNVEQLHRKHRSSGTF